MDGLRTVAALGLCLSVGCLSVPDAESEGSTGSSTTTTECPVGMLGCPCAAGNACLSPLICRDAVCNPPDGSTDGNTTSTTTGTSTTSPTSSTTATPTTGGSSGGTTGSVSTDGGSTTGSGFMHQIFVTSQEWEANDIESLQGADAHCEEAGGPGNWVAVLRTDQVDFSDRITIAGPVFRLDDTLVAAGSTEFFSSQLDAEINIDELGATVDSGQRAWIGNANNHCGDWTGSGGGGGGRAVRIEETNLFLIGSSNSQCSQARRLFCISQP